MISTSWLAGERPLTRAAYRRANRLRSAELVQEIPSLAQLRRDDLASDLEQLERARVAHTVEDARSLPAALHQPLIAKRTQMLRRPARIEPELGLEVAHAPLTLPQKLQDPYPHRMTQDAEELALQDVDRISTPGHATPFDRGAGSGRRPGDTNSPLDALSIVEDYTMPDQGVKNAHYTNRPPA